MLGFLKHYIGDERDVTLELEFKDKDEISKVISKVGEINGRMSKIKFGDMVSTFYLNSFYGDGSKVVFYITLFPPYNLTYVLSMVKRFVEIEMYAEGLQKKYFVNIDFLHKIEKLVKLICSTSGMNKEDLLHLLMAETRLSFSSIRRWYQTEAEVYHEKLIEMASEMGIRNTESVSFDPVKMSLLKRRKQHLCCVCEKTSISNMGIYSLCGDHLIEYKKHEKKFKEKYNLGDY